MRGLEELPRCAPRPYPFLLMSLSSRDRRDLHMFQQLSDAPQYWRGHYQRASSGKSDRNLSCGPRVPGK